MASSFLRLCFVFLIIFIFLILYIITISNLFKKFNWVFYKLHCLYSIVCRKNKWEFIFKIWIFSYFHFSFPQYTPKASNLFSLLTDEYPTLLMNLFLKDYLRKYFWENCKWFNERGGRETVEKVVWKKNTERELRCKWDLARTGWVLWIKTGKLCLCWVVFRYFIFTSFWAYKIYYVYGFMMLVLVILCIVTVCVTIVCTYFLLNAEDYRWWVLTLGRTSGDHII